MIIINPQFKNYKGEEINGSKVEYLLSLCRHPWKLREDAWDLKHTSIYHYIDDAGDCIIETLSNDRKLIGDYVNDLKAKGVIDEHGCAVGFDKNRRKIARIRSILESDELCAEAMVSEIGEILNGKED